VSFLDDDAPEESNIAPQDVASAARSCQAILILFAIIGLVLCLALAVYLLS